ncbi:MAG: DUF308 domain-containing protein [Ruthenibacterium sp.]|jgi:hypothetical protein
MFGYFWSRNATLGMAALYLVLGIVLLLFPGMSGTVFCWGLAAGAGLYAAGNFWRWHQGKKQGYSLPGLLLAGLLAAVLCLVCIFRPQFILSFLPLVLGIALLIDGIGKLPLAVDAVRTLHTALTPVLWAAVLPLVLGIVLIANPFGVAKTVIRFFGIGLIVDGVCDLITVLSARGR